MPVHAPTVEVQHNCNLNCGGDSYFLISYIFPLFALEERREVFGGGNITFLIEDKGREGGGEGGRSDKTFGIG